MQLISLWVEDFKNLKNFTIDFENQENLSIIIGNNGSGKSNILEAISAIFAEFYSNQLGFETSYSLCYKINDNIIEINKEYEWNEKNEIKYKVNGETQHKLFLQQQGLHPDKVIALYSGEDEKLYHSYYEYFEQRYVNSLSKEGYPSNPMIYLNKKYWNAALISFILWAYDGSSDAKSFIEEELNISELLDLYIEFDGQKIKKIKRNSPLEIFIKRFYQESPLQSMPFDIFYSAITQNYSYSELFNILYQSILSGAIVDISVVFNEDNIPSENFSEGEKKKILLKAAFDIVGSENSLILLDEPDAHLHVAAKNYLFDMAKQSAQGGRCVLIATHSPTMTNCADTKNIHMLLNNKEKIEVIDDEKVNLIQRLSSNIWTAMDQNIFFNTSRPLLLFEGMDDVIYVKKAISYFKDDYPLNVDMLYFGGATNAKEFIENLNEINLPLSKKVIVFFDKDQGGCEGLRSCIKAVSSNPNNIGDLLSKVNTEDKKTYCHENFYYLSYPKIDDDKSEFMVEDYFSKKTKATFIKQQIKSNPLNIKNFKGLDEKIKKNIRKSISTIDAKDMLNFKVLLAKIQEIIDGTNIQNLVEIS